MQVKETFAQQFAQIGQASNKAQFEIRFNAVQRGLVGQLNKEIQNVSSDETQRSIIQLQSKRDTLSERSEELRSIQTDLRTNSLRFLEITDKANIAVTAADADGNATLSDDELSALNIAIDEIKQDIFNLKLSHEFVGITDGNLGNILRGDILALESLTGTAGTIDAEGTETPTNDNRAILDALTSLATKATTFAESSTILVGGLNQLVTDTTKKAFDLEADLANLTLVELQKQEEEVANLETRYGNLIRSISLAFEVQSGLGDLLATGGRFEPEPGSILNIFS